MCENSEIDLQTSKSKAVLLRPNGPVNGNLLWAGLLPRHLESQLQRGLETLDGKGYWISCYPQGDGATFSLAGGRPYDEKVVLADFTSAFPFLQIEIPSPGKLVSEVLGDGELVTCIYAVPVDKMQIFEVLRFGKTTIHAPVDGENTKLDDHRWAELCDVVGDSDWVPDVDGHGLSSLLAFPLIERSISVPAALLREGRETPQGNEKLLKYLIEDADQALDLIRFTYCHFKRLEFLPERPGWIGQYAAAYLKPTDARFSARLVSGTPGVLRSTNNWLGLQIDQGDFHSFSDPELSIVDGYDTRKLSVGIKGGLRILNRAFYLGDLDSCFLLLIIAVDAVCGNSDLSGPRHHKHVCGVASCGSVEVFNSIYEEFFDLYELRNKMVHSGQTLALLDQDSVEACQFMFDILSRCIHCIVTNDVSDDEDLKAFSKKVSAQVKYPDRRARLSTADSRRTRNRSASSRFRPRAGQT